jgi:UDP-GlcNAc:undecaprenyl-phosphate GlcNAc-1-phosphate transferase
VLFRSTGLAPALGLWALRTLAIALTANLVNLLDLRPGRALKAYSLLAVVGAIPVMLVASHAEALVWLVLSLGPVAAVWRLDLSERAMLGDAGANAAGALAGWFIALTFSPWFLGGYVALVLALNLASEKISFSAVIEGNPVLSWLDGLGRLPAPSEETGESEKSGAKS